MHWLSFDEPQSRLKKALKRSQFFQDLLNSSDQSTPFSSSEISIRLAALAFALADISRFNSVCFNSVPAALNSLKPHSQAFYDALLDRIHAGMTNYLRGNYKWTEGENHLGGNLRRIYRHVLEIANTAQKTTFSPFLRRSKRQ